MNSESRPAEAPGWSATERFLLRPDVIATVLLIPVCISLCQRWHFNPNTDIALYLATSLIILAAAATPTVVIFWIYSALCGRRRRRGRIGTILFGSLRNVAVLTAMSWIYSHLKAGVLLADGYDKTLRTIDCTLLGGQEPWVLLRQWIPSSFADLLALVYVLFLPVLVMVIFWLSLAGRQKRSDDLTCAITLGYYLGAIAYHLVPSYGPAYTVATADPAPVSGFMSEIQQSLLECVRAIQHDPGGASVVPWRYIGAFPSLHMCHVLIAVWFLRHSRIGSALLTSFGVLTAISTVYFGWHYLVDLVGGGVVAVLGIWLTARCQSSLASAAGIKGAIRPAAAGSGGGKWKLPRPQLDLSSR